MSVVEYIKSSSQWMLDCFVSYFSTMGELIRNTFDRTHFPWSTFSFVSDWIGNHKSIKHFHHWVSHQSDSIVLAVVCAIIICLLLKCLCSCCDLGRPRRKLSPSSRNDAVNMNRSGVMHEGKRWFVQAQYDHDSAMNDMHDDTPAYEWVCFKCQQASEKALKAAIMIKHNQMNFSNEGHDLTALSRMLGDARLQELSTIVQGHVGMASRMRYPDLLPYPQVPRDVYTEQVATYAWETTDDILSHVQQHYIQ